MGEAKAEISASKIIAFIGMLFTLALGIDYFYLAGADALFILWGIIFLAIAFLIFVSLELIDFGPIKIPYQWWILIIFGVVLILITYFFGGNYFPAILILLAALLELIMQKKPYKASKMVAIVGAGFGVYECILYFMTGNVLLIVNAVFGLLLVILLLIVIFEWVDLKVIDYSWWFVLIVGFVFFTWITPGTAYGMAIGGYLIIIAFILILMAY